VSTSVHHAKGVNMFRKLTISAVVCAAVALALGGSWATAGTTDDDHVQTIVVRSDLTSFHFIDVGPTGVSPGDETTYTKKLTNQSGDTVGFLHGTCVVITVAGNNPQSAECQSTTRLGRRTLEVDGLDRLTEPQTFAIVGGTGLYREAGGVFVAGGGPNGDDVYEIRL